VSASDYLAMVKGEPTPGARLRARRKELGLTQEQVAARTGGVYDQTQYSKLERNVTEQPRGAAALAVARALEIAPSDLWKTSRSAAEAPTDFTSLRAEWDQFRADLKPSLDLLASILRQDSEEARALRRALQERERPES
jgi:transcriptional regulator with XRE-family HTH domain